MGRKFWTQSDPVSSRGIAGGPSGRRFSQDSDGAGAPAGRRTGAALPRPAPAPARLPARRLSAAHGEAREFEDTPYATAALTSAGSAGTGAAEARAPWANQSRSGTAMRHPTMETRPIQNHIAAGLCQ